MVQQRECVQQREWVQLLWKLLQWVPKQHHHMGGVQKSQQKEAKKKRLGSQWTQESQCQESQCQEMATRQWQERVTLLTIVLPP